MLIRRQFRKSLPLLFPLLVVVIFISTLSNVHDRAGKLAKSLVRSLSKGDSDISTKPQAGFVLQSEAEDLSDKKNRDNSTNGLDDEPEDVYIIPDRGNYRELFSLTTRDRKFIPIFLNGDAAYNPNIIPHPTKYDMWIVVAQHEQSKEEVLVSGQLTCTAGFLNGVLVCTEAPTILPVSPSILGVCEGDLAYFNFRFGPRDARMFYGPGVPYIAYGSQSQYTCLGIWIQDIRTLLEPFHLEQDTMGNIFKQATELRRPAPWNGIEKNFFVFWDNQGKAYAHHDIWPNRVFAQLEMDGTVGADLAPAIASKDQVCMAKYMPQVAATQESIHQATNSLSITLCKRKDPKCVPSDSNTFVMHLFHHKSYWDFHGVYEPYVLLFQQTAPFAVHAISQRPLWIYGRNALTNDTHSLQYEGREEYIPEGHTEMFYVTSISWRTHGQKYHGYIDDPLFLAFGIEDSRSAIMDVLAGDLLQDLALC
jgi:hypothetical protein